MCASEDQGPAHIIHRYDTPERRRFQVSPERCQSCVLPERCRCLVLPAAVPSASFKPLWFRPRPDPKRPKVPKYPKSPRRCGVARGRTQSTESSQVPERVVLPLVERLSLAIPVWFCLRWNVKVVKSQRTLSRVVLPAVERLSRKRVLPVPHWPPAIAGARSARPDS